MQFGARLLLMASCEIRRFTATCADSPLSPSCFLNFLLSVCRVRRQNGAQAPGDFFVLLVTYGTEGSVTFTHNTVLHTTTNWTPTLCEWRWEIVSTVGLYVRHEPHRRAATCWLKMTDCTQDVIVVGERRRETEACEAHLWPCGQTACVCVCVRVRWYTPVLI